MPGVTRSAPGRISRFAPSERVAHWLVAGAFFGMLATGLLIGGGGTNLLLIAHLALAGALVIGLLVLLIRVRARRALARTVRDLAHLDPTDRRWLVEAPQHVLGRGTAPPAGRFNAGQKINARLVALGMGALYLTGVAQFVPGPLAGLHGLAAAAMGLLVAGHVYFALVDRRTRPALSGMLRGDVDRQWAVEHHPRWVARVEAAESSAQDG
jgi:formate dehydrogenase subunit gamma